MLVCKSMFTYRFIQHTKVSISVSGSWFTMATNGSADFRSSTKEFYSVLVIPQIHRCVKFTEPQYNHSNIQKFLL